MSSVIYEAPPISPEDFEAWYRMGDDERFGHEPYPVHHLVGKIALEDRVYSLEEKLHHGLPLNSHEQGLLEV